MGRSWSITEAGVTGDVRLNASAPTEAGGRSLPGPREPGGPEDEESPGDRGFVVLRKNVVGDTGLEPMTSSV
jgi:hypothetical protein